MIIFGLNVRLLQVHFTCIRWFIKVFKHLSSSYMTDYGRSSLFFLQLPVFVKWSLSLRCLLPTCHTKQEYRVLWSVSWFSSQWILLTFLFKFLAKYGMSCLLLKKLCRYNYQLPPGKPNHFCGGADRWADVGSSGEIFCPAGYYCPSTIQKFSCSSGYYFYPTCLFSFIWSYVIVEQTHDPAIELMKKMYMIFLNIEFRSW